MMHYESLHICYYLSLPVWQNTPDFRLLYQCNLDRFRGLEKAAHFLYTEIFTKPELHNLKDNSIGMEQRNVESPNQNRRGTRIWTQSGIKEIGKPYTHSVCV